MIVASQFFFLFSLDQTDQTGAMTHLSGKCLKESWLYRKTSQLKVNKVIFYYLDRFFRNLAKTNKKLGFFGSENHKIDIFSVTSLRFQILAEDVSFHMSYCLLSWNEYWSIQWQLFLTGHFWTTPASLTDQKARIV